MLDVEKGIKKRELTVVLIMHKHGWLYSERRVGRLKFLLLLALLLTSWDILRNWVHLFSFCFLSAWSKRKMLWHTHYWELFFMYYASLPPALCWIATALIIVRVRPLEGSAQACYGLNRYKHEQQFTTTFQSWPIEFRYRSEHRKMKEV